MHSPGISNAVGLAIAAAHIAATFNKPGLEIIDNYTFCFLGDGCLQEGIASEACSLAGHLQLGKLIAVWDDNHITIDGETAVSFTEDVEMRFRAYGWHVIHVENGNDDLSAMYNAIEEAKAETNKPTLIRLTTIIGFGSKLQGTHGVHGNPLKPDDAQAIKKLFGFDPEKFFDVPAATTETYGKIAEKGTKANQEWNKLFEQYKEKYPNEAKDLERRQAGKLPDGWESCLPVYKPTDSAVASRKLSETVLSKIADTVPEFICGVFRTFYMSAEVVLKCAYTVCRSYWFKLDAVEGSCRFPATFHQARHVRRPICAVRNSRARYGSHYEWHIGVRKRTGHSRWRYLPQFRILRCRCCQTSGSITSEGHLGRYSRLYWSRRGRTHSSAYRGA